MTAVAPNVLIAENDDVCRLFLADNLEADGYRPVRAADTAEALGDSRCPARVELSEHTFRELERIE